MINYKTEKIEQKIPISVTCDVCKKTYKLDGNDDIIEAQEFVYVNFLGGFGSVFGDGVEMELQVCQHCFKEKFGDYVRCVNCVDE